MHTPSFDPGQYKAELRRDWSIVATGWHQWWETFERGAQSLSDRLMELAHITTGQRVLDVATGIGEPAITAARRVGPTGQITAIDLSPQMLAIAQKRAAALGLQNIDFREMDAEMLDLADHTFDAIVCRWGLMFLPNLARALDTMRRLLVPGGRLAAAVWDVPSKVPLLSLAMGVVRQHLQVPPPSPDIPSPFNLADVNILECALTNADFTDVHTERHTVTFTWNSVDDYIRFHQAVSPQIHTLLAHQPAERQAIVWQAVKKAVQQYTTPDGSVRLANEAICVVGQR